jgi:hypothetical protein
MKKKLTLWILLVPTLIFGQVEIKDGALTIDFSKKNKQQQDSTQKDAPPPKVKKQKANTDQTPEQEEKPDYAKEGLFKALFIAGLNLTQIDGDYQAGYVHPGAHVGVGTLVKFHKNFSVSLAIVYSMKGATQKFVPLTYQQTVGGPQYNGIYRSRQNWDYIQIPVMLNIHDKKLVMAGIGLSASYLVRNKLMFEAYDANDNPTNQFVGFQQALDRAPSKFDLGAVINFQFLIKRVFGIGAQFEYSLLPLKASVGQPYTKVRNMRNNAITIRFSYILDPVAIKNKKKK